MHDDDEEPGLLISPAFWLGGALSVLAWHYLYLGLQAALT